MNEPRRRAARKVDPITLEVVRNKLEGIANEMQMRLLQSAFSPIVKEGMDCSAAIFSSMRVTPLTGFFIHESCLEEKRKAQGWKGVARGRVFRCGLTIGKGRDTLGQWQSLYWAGAWALCWAAAR